MCQSKIYKIGQLMTFINEYVRLFKSFTVLLMILQRWCLFLKFDKLLMVSLLAKISLKAGP